MKAIENLFKKGSSRNSDKLKSATESRVRLTSNFPRVELKKNEHMESARHLNTMTSLVRAQREIDQNESIMKNRLHMLESE